jgi:hypothetical protein
MKRISWSDGDSPSYDDGCGFFIVRQMTVVACMLALLLHTLRLAVILRKISRARFERAPGDPTRAAEILSSRVITPGSQTSAPQIEAVCRCDDGKTRIFVSGPDGRWVRKAKKGGECDTQTALDN